MSIFFRLALALERGAYTVLGFDKTALWFVWIGMAIVFGLFALNPGNFMKGRGWMMAWPLILAVAYFIYVGWAP